MKIPDWLRVILAIVAGFVAWFVVATIGNVVIRALLAGYAEVEKAMTFSFAMLVARLALGAVSSVAAGFVCAAIAPRARAATYAMALVLLVLFVPIHVSLWDKFPIWYHVVFLGSLVLFVVLGARLRRRKNATPTD